MEENPPQVSPTPTEPVAPSTPPINPPPPSPKFNTKIIALLAALILIIILAAAFYLVKAKNASLSPSPTPAATVAPTPTSSPTSSPSASPVASTAPTSTLVPTSSPVSSQGTINVVFLKWDTSASEYATQTPITGISSSIHVNGGTTQDFNGSPNWSATFAPGSYDVNVDTPSTYSFHASDCNGGGNCQNLGQSCSRRITLTAGANITVSCWFSN